MKPLRSLLIPFVLLLLGASAAGAQDTTSPAPRAEAARDVTPVTLFWTSTCPHCAKAKTFLEGLAARDESIRLSSRELGSDAENERAFLSLTEHFRIHPPAVPLIVVGERRFVGFDSDATTGKEIVAAVAACRRTRCADLAAQVISGGPGAAIADQRPGKSATPAGAPVPQSITLPLIGELRLADLSLPVLTIALAAIDGFNPCAMWVLVFLIGLLLGIHDPVRMWSYGAVFLLTSALVYFAFLAAWLNVFLWLGSLGWVKIVIGLFALGAGGYYLWQFVSNPSAACPVTSTGERQAIMTRLKTAVAERSFLLAILGIVVLAAAVNLIELLCSAGIPAVYTQVLALSDLPLAAYYGYLALYILVFLIDDAVVFVTAMVTLRAAGLTAQYARYSHLIGGVVMGVIGVLLLLRPDWLAFA